METESDDKARLRAALLLANLTVPDDAELETLSRAMCHITAMRELLRPIPSFALEPALVFSATAAYGESK